MSFRFIHAADIHLGYQQYGSRQRFDDFFSAFDQVIDHALEVNADCIILAGDLFHKRAIDPLTLYRATQSMIRLRNAGIKAIAVEGNHERPDPRQHVGWLDFMARMGLLILLSPEYRDGQLVIEPWDAETCRGAYVDVGKVRVLGVKYVGAAAPKVLADMSDALEATEMPPRDYCIAVLHAGLNDIIEHYGGTLQRGDIEVLRPHCDYVALGHIHKPYAQDGWIFNPGSLETNSVEEWQWQERGFYDVTVTPQENGQEDWQHEATLVPVQRRHFELLTLKVGAYETPAALMGAAEALISRARTKADRPVVELRLTGILPFDHAKLDIDALRQRLTDTYEPLVCNIRDQTVPSDYAVLVDEGLPRAELERNVLHELITRDSSRRDQAEAWAALALSIKQLALSGRDSQAVLDEIGAFVQRSVSTDMGDPDSRTEEAPSC